MRAPSPRTRRQIRRIALRAGAIGLAIWFCHLALANQRKAVELHLQRHREEQLLAEADRWENRSVWVSRRIPRFSSPEMAAASLRDRIYESLRRGKLEVEAADLSGPDLGKSGTFYERTAIDLRVLGSEEAVVRWIHGLQVPERFLSIDRLVLRPEDHRVHCEVTVAQWYLVE